MVNKIKFTNRCTDVQVNKIKFTNLGTCHIHLIWQCQPHLDLGPGWDMLPTVLHSHMYPETMVDNHMSINDGTDVHGEQT